MAHEIEAKFQVTSPQVFDMIRLQKQVSGYRFTDQKRSPQWDTYLDTAAGALFRQGASLRLREKQGTYVVTFKRQIDENYVRTELETSLTPSQAQDLLNGNLTDVRVEAVQSALTYLENEAVFPVLHVGNTRESWTINSEIGRIKICFDDIRYTNTDQTQSAEEYELELELKEGDGSFLQLVAQALSRQYDLQPNHQSKYARGVALIHQNFRPLTNLSK